MGDAGERSVRVWCDGCYDMVHFGHANSLRQAKDLGDYLIVGVHTDEEINRHKGPTVFTQSERAKMLLGIKWVDEVVEEAPYITTLDTLDKYQCDFCSHGEDITTTADGKDAYYEVKEAKRYKEVKRTKGVSTTDVVGRILQMTEAGCEQSLPSRKGDDAKFSWKDIPLIQPTTEVIKSSKNKEHEELKLISLKIRLDPTEISYCQKGGKIVYVAGAFDLFHVGHLDFLQQAAAQGDFLIVGVHADHVVNQHKGSSYPIMKLNERVLSVLACKYVSQVVEGVPYSITEELMQHFRVDLVCHGQTPVTPDEDGSDPYRVPKEQGVFKSLDSHNNMTTEKIVERVIQRKEEFEERNRKKEAKERLLESKLIS